MYWALTLPYCQCYTEAKHHAGETIVCRTSIFVVGNRHVAKIYHVLTGKIIFNSLRVFVFGLQAGAKEHGTERIVQSLIGTHVPNLSLGVNEYVIVISSSASGKETYTRTKIE